MARITKYPIFNHLRSEAASHVIRYRGGRAVRSGRGVAFWFRPLNTAIAEMPLDDQELPFLFRGRSSDLQEVVAQGIITYRVTDPDTLAGRIDFSIDLATGLHIKAPLDQIAGRLSGLAQQYSWAVMAATPLRDLVTNGINQLRVQIGEGLAADPSLAEMGLAIVSIRVSAVQPSAEVEKELAAPTRERIAADADEAAFARRAAAVDKERAISENELANKIELARRAAELLDQEGANERRRATESAATALISAKSEAAVHSVGAAADAEALKLIETERNALEAERIALYRELAPTVLFGLAAHEFADKIQTIEHLNVTPDLLSSLLTDLASGDKRRPEAS